ncbi:MAG: PAS domain-containing sensor histidine kinase [Holosporaceae bacterium]|jgi:PAS domain S-box-containing protein|nr:PAS domain-containing sensor histidine kinase [Holosporaceae bacterium]
MSEKIADHLESDNSSQIGVVVAFFRNLSTRDSIKNSVIYFWESHTKNPDDKKRTQATIDLIYKRFDVPSCEKYEVRTGYLSRYNYLFKPKDESTIGELEAAIEKGEEEQSEWIKRCNPRLPGFIQQNWQDCISRNKNPYFEERRKILADYVKNDDAFESAFSQSVDNFISKRSVNAVNSKSYLIEENAWILTLPLLHPDKQIYIIHVGNVTESTLILFTRFSYLRDRARLLLPTFSNERFNCMSDFLMEYKNKKNYGYSHPVDDDETVNSFVSLNTEQLSVEVLLKMLLDERSEKELLSSVVSKMPGHIFWLSRDGVYLGCNDLQAQMLGLSSRDKIVGKTNYDLLPEMEARKHNNINKMVMERGVCYSGQETSTMQGGKFSYLSRKAPLFNSSRTKIIGLLGISIDITDRVMAEEERKKTKELKFQNKLHQMKMQIQEEFSDFIATVAHDIVSPLASLNFIMKSCQDFSEKQRVSLRNAITDIGNIANVLLNRYKQAVQDSASTGKQHILVPLALLETIYQKKREYHDRDIDICYVPNPSFNFTFIEGDQGNFRRMLSNLINNSVDACEGKSGVVVVSLSADNKNVVIKIKDDGKGMSKEIVAKILGDGIVCTTKSTGHGLGMNHVKNILDLHGGEMTIDSAEGVGTTITLVFPRAEAPKLIADKLTFQRGCFVVVLDNDESMKNLWEKLLKNYMDDIVFKFFPNGDNVVAFLNSLSENDQIVLLVDYELGDKDGGLRFVMENGMKDKSVIVTSIYNDRTVQGLIESCGMKMLPKQYLMSNIQVTISDQESPN